MIPSKPNMNNTSERLTTVVIDDPANLRFEYLSDTLYFLGWLKLIIKLALLLINSNWNKQSIVNNIKITLRESFQIKHKQIGTAIFYD